MSVVKIIELMGCSEKSWEDAVKPIRWGNQRPVTGFFGIFRIPIEGVYVPDTIHISLDGFKTYKLIKSVSNPKAGANPLVPALEGLI